MLFSLITINTWKCDGQYNKRLPLLVSGIIQEEPHVVLCQEVYESLDKKESTKAYLEDQLQMKAYYFPSRKKVRKVSETLKLSYSGLCIFTNIEVYKIMETFLPSSEMDGERTAQLVTLEFNGKTIGIINTHLTHLRNEDSLRVEQIKCVLDLISSENLDIIFLCGDLNASLQSMPLQYLLNAPHAFHSTFPEYTPTHVRGNQLDYILYKSKSPIKKMDNKIIMNQAVDVIYPSDHFGLYASFEII